MISDNRSTFKSVAKITQEIVKDPCVSDYLSGLKVKWSFNIEKAPWWGGTLGRMIGLTKRCLRKIVGQAKFTHDELMTVITEIESKLNSSPISCIMSSDDLEEPLTPSYLIVGRHLLNLPDDICYCNAAEDFNANPSAFLLNKRMKYLHTVVDRFWMRWKNEYLINLRERCNKKGNSHSKAIQFGDIVIIHSDDSAHSFWKLGKVKEIIPGLDGEVRGMIQVLSGGKRTSLMRRPVRLIPLEVNDHNTESSTANNT
uniref:DUF5641 domain-containing protein n=1 Tax=Amphimedon queenslandica TaxID=400682 RepID=A0A1X7VGN0_AMPQE